MRVSPEEEEDEGQPILEPGIQVCTFFKNSYYQDDDLDHVLLYNL